MSIEKHSITDRDTWLAWRKHDITASDVGAVFGLHPYKTPLKLWTEKTDHGFMEDMDSAVLKRGRWLENAVIAACQDEHPEWGIHKPGLYLRDPDYRIGATPDAIAKTEPGAPSIIVQCKTVAEPIFKAQWQDGPPQHYYLQALTEAMLWDAPRAVLAVLIVSAFGADYREYEVPRHAGAEQRIRDGVARFWQDIAVGVTPKADYAADGDLLAKMHAPDAVLPPIDLSGDNLLPELLEERERLAAEVKEREARLEAIKNECVEKLAGATVGTLNGWTITRKLSHRKEMVLKATSFPVLRITRHKQETAAA